MGNSQVPRSVESNLLKWIALGPDYEYPLIHVLYLTLCLNGTSQMIYSQAAYPFRELWL